MPGKCKKKPIFFVFFLSKGPKCAIIIGGQVVGAPPGVAGAAFYHRKRFAISRGRAFAGVAAGGRQGLPAQNGMTGTGLFRRGEGLLRGWADFSVPGSGGANGKNRLCVPFQGLAIRFSGFSGRTENGVSPVCRRTSPFPVWSSGTFSALSAAPGRHRKVRSRPENAEFPPG